MPLAAHTILSEGIQKEEEKYHVISLIRGIQNMTQMNLPMKQGHRHRLKVSKVGLWEQGGVGSQRLETSCYI